MLSVSYYSHAAIATVVTVTFEEFEEFSSSWTCSLPLRFLNTRDSLRIVGVSPTTDVFGHIENLPTPIRYGQELVKSSYSFNHMWCWDRDDSPPSYLRLRDGLAMEVSSSPTGPWKPISSYYFWRAATDPEFREIPIIRS